MKPGTALQTIMDAQGITHAQLAERIGVTDRCINSRIKDKHAMQLDTLVKMFDGVGYKIVAVPKHGDGRQIELDWE